MKSVWKFPLPIQDEVVIQAPIGSTALLVAAQQGILCLWARVDPAAELIDYTFLIRGTGHDVPDGVWHVGSAQVGPFVWHVFEGARSNP